MTTPTYPPGKTFLDNLKRSFTDVPVNKENGNAIATVEFLEASESLTTLFGKLIFGLGTRAQIWVEVTLRTSENELRSLGSNGCETEMRSGLLILSRCSWECGIHTREE